jgi:hypothetical protein
VEAAVPGRERNVREIPETILSGPNFRVIYTRGGGDRLLNLTAQESDAKIASNYFDEQLQSLRTVPQQRVPEELNAIRRAPHFEQSSVKHVSLGQAKVAVFRASVQEVRDGFAGVSYVPVTDPVDV